MLFRSLGVIRIRYKDSAGNPRMHEARLDDLTADKPFPLPDSDLTVAFVQARHAGTPAQFALEFGDDEIYMAKLSVRKGTGPALDQGTGAGHSTRRAQVSGQLLRGITQAVYVTTPPSQPPQAA